MENHGNFRKMAENGGFLVGIGHLFKIIVAMKF